MASSYAEAAAHIPITWSIIGILLIIWFYLWNSRSEALPLFISFRSVVDDGEFYRVFTSAFTHLSFLHLGFNLFSLWTCGHVELVDGPVAYLRATFLILVGEAFFYLLISYAGFRYFNRPQMRETAAIGYSGVIFGLITIDCLRNPSAMVPVFGLFQLPYFLYPFFMLGVIQLFVPNASWVGHLGGLFMGILLGVHAFDWINDWVILGAAIWTFLCFLYNLYRKVFAGQWQLPESVNRFFRLSDSSSSGSSSGSRSRRLVNGRFVDSNSSSNSEMQGYRLATGHENESAV